MTIWGAGFLEKGRLKNPDHPLNERGGFSGKRAEFSPKARGAVPHRQGRPQAGRLRKRASGGGMRAFPRASSFTISDKLLMDEKALNQAQSRGEVLIVEGCFDVAKLIEAGI